MHKYLNQIENYRQVEIKICFWQRNEHKSKLKYIFTVIIRERILSVKQIQNNKSDKKVKKVNFRCIRTFFTNTFLNNLEIKYKYL